MLQSKIARSIDRRKSAMRALSPRKYFRHAMNSDKLFSSFLPDPAKGLAKTSSALTVEEGDRLLRIVSASTAIQRHYHLFLWLRGEVQEFLPHEILVSAWGDFSTGNLKLDVASALPGVRTEQLAHCSIDELVKTMHDRWATGSRRPIILGRADVSPLVGQCACPLHRKLHEMDSVLLHGVRDARGGHDSIYLAFTRGAFTPPESRQRFLALVDPLIMQIDAAYRKVSALPLSTAGDAAEAGVDFLELSGREQEVLDWICQGKSNSDIASALSISPFTVKNHLQRIFRKIGVSNRTEAATKYSRALREVTDLLKR